MYLLRVVEEQHAVLPKANIPTVELPAADPFWELHEDAVATAFVSPEYVYLFLVLVDVAVTSPPNAKIPIVELPAADPKYDPALELVAPAFTLVEYIYLLRVVTTTAAAYPIAKIPTVALPTAALRELIIVDEVPAETTQPE